MPVLPPIELPNFRPPIPNIYIPMPPLKLIIEIFRNVVVLLSASVEIQKFLWVNGKQETLLSLYQYTRLSSYPSRCTGVKA